MDLLMSKTKCLGVNSKGLYKKEIQKNLKEIKKQNRKPLNFGVFENITNETIEKFISDPYNLEILKRLAHK